MFDRQCLNKWVNGGKIMKVLRWLVLSKQLGISLTDYLQYLPKQEFVFILPLTLWWRSAACKFFAYVCIHICTCICPYMYVFVSAHVHLHVMECIHKLLTKNGISTMTFRTLGDPIVYIELRTTTKLSVNFQRKKINADRYINRRIFQQLMR